MKSIRLTKTEAQIVSDVLMLVMNDTDWQEMASATDRQWDALGTAYEKISDAALGAS
jgi:hypothetical protein